MRLAGQRCYLDANVFIYYAEQHAVFGGPIRSLIERSTAGELTLVTSELSLAEVLVLPLKLGQTAHVAGYEQPLQTGDGFEMVPVTRKILTEGAAIRASHGCKLPDAIHIATARSENCALLITQDRQLANVDAIKTALISDLPPSNQDPQ